MPHLALGTLTVLAVGAIVLSLVQSKPVAGRQLHLAAADTVAVGNLSIHESIAQVVGGQLHVLRTESEEYEAPSSLEAFAGTQSEILVGGRVYASTNGGKSWTVLSNSANAAQGVALVLAPLRMAEQATGVVASAGQQRYSFSIPTTRLARQLDLGVSAAGSPALATVEVSVSGEFVTAVRSHFTIDGASYVLVDSYSNFDRLPPLVAPPITGG